MPYHPFAIACRRDLRSRKTDEAHLQVTSCCIPEFLAMYSPVQDFADAINGNSELAALIAEGSCDLDSPPTFSSSRRAGTEFGKPEYSFFDTFSGMSLSYIAAKEIVDPYIGQFKATLFLDEVELRNQASMLKGTVGVEHTLDTFVGLSIVPAPAPHTCLTTPALLSALQT
eukprot:3862414-Rhodomonas_salina.2